MGTRTSILGLIATLIAAAGLAVAGLLDQEDGPVLGMAASLYRASIDLGPLIEAP